MSSRFLLSRQIFRENKKVIYKRVGQSPRKAYLLKLQEEQLHPKWKSLFL